MTTRQAPVTNERIAAKDAGAVKVGAARVLLDGTTGRYVFSTSAIVGDTEVFVSDDGSGITHLNTSSASKRTVALLNPTTVLI